MYCHGVGFSAHPTGHHSAWKSSAAHASRFLALTRNYLSRTRICISSALFVTLTGGYSNTFRASPLLVIIIEHLVVVNDAGLLPKRKQRQKDFI